MNISLEQAAKEYVECLYSPPNGLGQHVHRIYGRSDVMLRTMTNRFGSEEALAAIDKVFTNRNAATAKE